MIKKIKDFEDYFVSAQGGVLSTKNREHRILRTRVNKKGYEYVNLQLDGVQITKSVHRLVAEAFLPEYSSELEVNHIDGNKTNNDVNNLEMVSRIANVRHAVSKGLFEYKRGEENNMARLTKEVVAKIREEYKHCDVSQRTLARKYGVSNNAIFKVLHNITWREK